MSIVEKEAELRESLRAVVDPEIGMNIVELGLVRQIDIQDESAHVMMIMTTPFCPYGGWMIQQVKEAAERTLNKSVKVTVLPDLWDFNYMEDPGLLSGW